MSEDPSPDRARDEARDELHLEALRDARADGDLFGAREALGQLLGPYWDWAYSIAFGQFAGVPDRKAEAEVVAQDLIAKLVGILTRKTAFDVPFHVVARVNLRWLIKSYWRARRRNRSFPQDPSEMPDGPGLDDDYQSLDKQAFEFNRYLDDLGPRDRELIIERLFFAVSPQDSAERHGITRNALDQAYFRALNKLRENQPQSDVRDTDEGAA